MFSEESNESLALLSTLSMRTTSDGLGVDRWGFSTPLATVLGWRGKAQENSRRIPVAWRGSCAVVGSSGSLLQSQDGAAIDAADVVIRLNFAPTPRKRRANVGSRTTWAHTTPHPFLSSGPFASGLRPFTCRLLGRRLYVATFPDVSPINGTGSRRRGFGPVPEYKLGGNRRSNKTAPVVYYCHVPWHSRCWSNLPYDGSDRISPTHVAHTRRQLGLPRAPPRWPSTGAIAVALALRRCRCVDLYGFDGNATLGCARYYGKCEPTAQYYSAKHYWHDWRREAEWITGLRRVHGAGCRSTNQQHRRARTAVIPRTGGLLGYFGLGWAWGGAKTPLVTMVSETHAGLGS